VWGAVRARPATTDAVVAVAFAVLAFVGMYSLLELNEELGQPSLDGLTRPGLVIGLLAVTLPLALRRRFPLAVVLVTVIAFVVGRTALELQEPTVTVSACWLAIYSAALHGRGRARLPVVAVASAVMLGEIVRELFFLAPGLGEYRLSQSFFLVYNVVILALPWVLGAAVRSLRDRQAELAAQAAELQRERELNARRAVLEERVRIARELHDVVAHHVSVMGVQAAAARRVMRRRPDQADEALDSIETSSRQAVLELHRLLGFLRRPDQVEDLAPQPDLAQLDDLVAQARRGDLAVDLVIDGARRPLPRTLEVSAYRVIQEALTNAVKHSGGTTATVRVDYGPTTLEIDVVDDGPGAAERTARRPGGHGLIGMRERVGLHGGHLRAGPRAEGGFVVHATLPLDGQGA
jgi:signal transduction histidine kinase